MMSNTARKITETYSEDKVDVGALEWADLRGQISAIHKSQAVIEFDLDGTIRSANDNFLSVMGYSLDEVKGKHHRIFCDPVYASSVEYAQFWKRLGRGEFESMEYKRIAKGGKEVWIRASYNPIMDASDKPFKVVKFAVDVSEQKLKDAQLAALSRAQAVIEFTPDGKILDANDNFLKTLGYSLQEIKGEHHSMFCAPELSGSKEYVEFWRKLRNGAFQSDQFMRVAKSGQKVWIQASYVPVFDMTGKVFKVVKYATNITEQKTAELEVLEALIETAQQLGAAASELTATATQMTGNAERTNSVAQATATASGSVSEGVRTVATNTEEMSASIKEISRNASEASTTSHATMKQAEQTNELITRLGESSKEIGSVIKVISSIAQQTNLLALNATIEAARAGDAGRGFAVVANEVKELAKQTATATEDITNRITGIQRDTSNAVGAVSAIGDTISRLNSIASAIAASVEEQSATTREVARVIQESSRGVMEITSNVQVVSQAATETSVGSTQVLAAAGSLSTLATSLEGLITRIKR